MKNCNDFWVVTNLPPLEKSCPRNSKKAKVKEDIKELGVGHFDQELESLRGDFESEKWVRQGYLSKGNVLSSTRIHGCLGGDNKLYKSMGEW